ncbi:MAG: integrase [Chloroflexi bacterium]|jgi:hypothetical protein|nr:integrase [Chloroflexota bacterium]
MEKYDMQYLLENNNPVDEAQDVEEVVSLAGYQVTKAELFAHTREPAVTIWENRLKFNMACLRRFPGVTHIQILIHPEQKRVIIRPCEPDTPDSLRWAIGGGENEIRNRDLLCKLFAARIYDLMQWNPQYRYKLLGNPATCNGEVLFLFRLTDFELFLGGKRKGSFLPEEWRNYFGVPVEQHEDAYKVDLADGYITTDQA